MDESHPHPEPTEPPRGAPADAGAPTGGIPAARLAATSQEQAQTEVIPVAEVPESGAGAAFEGAASVDALEAPAPPRTPARWPAIVSIVVGSLLIMPGSLLVWFAYFVIGLNLLGGSTGEISGGEIPNGGSITLLEQTTYSIDAYNTSFSDDLPAPTGSPAERDADAALLPQCTVQGPDGADVPVEPQPMGDDTPDVLAFTTEAEGEYTATCESESLVGEVQLSILEFTPPDGGIPAAGVAPIAGASLTAAIGLAMLVFGIFRLRRANKQRRVLREQAAAVAAQWQDAYDDSGAVTDDGADLLAVPGAQSGPSMIVGGAGRPAGPALPEPKPSDDPRVVFSPENAFGVGKSNGKPPSMVPAILAIVVGGLLMVGGPIGGALAPIISVFTNPGGMAEGGAVQNGDSMELPGNKNVSFSVSENPNNLPQTDEEWENYTPPPTPECSITDPNGDPITLEIEEVGGGYESASFISTDSGEYTFQCQLDERYDTTLYVFPMGDAGDAGMPTSMIVGLTAGGVGFVVLITGIVLAVRNSARRHDAGA